MRIRLFLAVAVAIAGLSGSANATTSVNADVTVDTTWGAGANTCPIILERPIFVTNGATLTVLPGCVVRGQPRTGPVVPGSTVGTPGALIVTRQGKINSVGSPTNPITYTTAAVDNNTDGIPDDVSPADGFFDAWTTGDAFLDAAPTTSPLAPLNAAGDANVTLWGGMAILGNAPTNLNQQFGVGIGNGLLEGLTIPGFPASQATYGGIDPHDNSGKLQYVSIRHGGDEIGDGNELNCLSLGAVGDGTVLSHVECYCNFDDGFEWFGGTVDGDHLVSTFIGDDTFDLDLGYTGLNQFVLGIMPTFDEDDADAYGSKSGDKGTEFDGDDVAERGGDINVRADGLPWPFSNPSIFNMTLVGSTPDGANPATDPNSANRGVQLRNGFGGKLLNTVVINTGTAEGLDVTDGDGSIPGISNAASDNVGLGRIAIVASTFDDVAAFGAPENTARTNGDGIAAGLGAPGSPLSDNCVNVALFPGLVSENTAIEPKGVNGKLAPGSIGTWMPGGAFNPDPAFGLSCIGNGVPPAGPGLDSAATYRGAFERNVPNWTGDGLGTANAGWSAIGQSGLIVP